MATSQQVQEFRRNNTALVALAENDLADFWSALRLDGDPVLVRNAMLDFYPELVTAYGDAAALLAADFYDATRNVPPSAARFTAVLSQPVVTDQSQAAARWGVGPLFQSAPLPADAFSRLSGALQRLVLQPGRSTQIDSALRDPQRMGFARVPVGATCPFCTMLASRGFVYANERAAGESNKWHNRCDCVIVSGRSLSDLPDDYDVDEYLRRYQASEGIPA